MGFIAVGMADNSALMMWDKKKWMGHTQSRGLKK